MNGVDVFGFIPGYTEEIYEPGKQPLLIVLLSFLIAFAAVRTYTRLARTRGWGSGSVGGVHLHHDVPGLILALIGGFLAYTPAGDNGWVQLFGAILFGVGAALVLDEFALIFHMEDVYWSQEGRTSVNAAITGAIVAGLLLVVSAPFGIDGRHAGEPGYILFLIVAANVVFALVTFLKGKPFTGAAGIVLPLVAWVGAARLARPSSPWARWFYRPKGTGERRDRLRARKLARARRRAESGFGLRFSRWLVDLVGGKPTPPPLPRFDVSEGVTQLQEGVRDLSTSLGRGADPDDRDDR